MNDLLLDLSQVLYLALPAGFLLLLGLWLHRAGALRRLLPPPEDLPVRWGGGEVAAALFLGYALVPALVQQLLAALGFFNWLYGGLPTEYLAVLGIHPEAAFPGSLPWGPLALAVERGPIESARRTLWISALAFPLQMLGAPLLLRLASGTRFGELGLSGRYLGRNLLAGLLGWLVVTPGVYTIQFFAQLLVEGPPESHPLTKVAEHPALAVEWFLIVFVAVVAAPLWEELFFRGVLQRWLTHRPRGGMVVMAGCGVVAALSRWDALAAGWRTGRPAELLAAAAPLLFVAVMALGYLLLRAWGR